MHPKAKKRIADFKKQEKPELTKEGKIKNSLIEICNKAMKSNISEESKEKIALVKSRIEINL